MLLWNRRLSREKYLLLEVKAERLLIEERQREAFAGLFGGHYQELFDVFWHERLIGRYFDYIEALRFIASHGQPS
jgi:hypothetical protein